MYYNNETLLYSDGSYIKAADAKTDLFGQSLHYGYAVFEGVRAYKTADGSVKIFKAKEHFDRLKHSAELVNIPYPFLNDELIAATYQLLEKNNLEDAYVRPLVYCPPNMSLTQAKTSHIMITAWEWGAYLGNQLLRVMTSSFQRPNPKGFKIEAKVSGHYVNSIMATQEAKDHGYDEALLLDMNDNVAEGPGANIFFEKNGMLYTPPLGNILPGITRATVLELCHELSMPVQEKSFKIDELRQADAAFYCGTAAEVIGWESLDNKPFNKEWNASLGKKIQDAYKCKVLGKQYNLATELSWS